MGKRSSKFWPWTAFSTILALASSSAALKCAAWKSDLRLPPSVLQNRKTQIQASMGTKKNEGMLVLHGLRCPSAEIKTQKAQLSRTRCFGALNSPEKYRHRVLCSECVGILQPGETQTLWQEKWFGNLGWRVYDCPGAWDSPLECCIADAIAGHGSMPNRHIHSILMEPAMPKHLFMCM